MNSARWRRQNLLLSRCLSSTFLTSKQHLPAPRESNPYEAMKHISWIQVRSKKAKVLIFHLIKGIFTSWAVSEILPDCAMKDHYWPRNEEINKQNHPKAYKTIYVLEPILWGNSAKHALSFLDDLQEFFIEFLFFTLFCGNKGVTKKTFHILTWMKH